MTPPITNQDLLRYLKSIPFKGGFIDKLKVYYRPLVCPYVELISRLRSGESIADVGCGSGQFCLLLAKFGNPSSIYGIEISERLVANAKSLFIENSSVPAEFEIFDGHSFPGRIKEIDKIFLNDVLHHVPKASQEQFVADLLKSMKKGAQLIIKDIDGSSIFRYFNKMHDLIFAGEIGNEISLAKIKKLLVDNGAQIISSTKKQMYVYPHYTVVAQK
jgi:2-polyprenyl-3-methyl-5-hydroxy-6-metoxy-1,4-benzoquinol methylase